MNKLQKMQHQTPHLKKELLAYSSAIGGEITPLLEVVSCHLDRFSVDRGEFPNFSKDRRITPEYLSMPDLEKSISLFMKVR